MNPAQVMAIEAQGNSRLPPISSVITNHCFRIRDTKTPLSEQQLAAILDDVVRELKLRVSSTTSYRESFNNVVLALNAARPAALLSLNSHYFFVLVRNVVQALLQQLCTDYQLNSLAAYLLRNCAVFLERLVKRINDVGKILHWITNLAFVDTLANCFEEIEKLSKSGGGRRYIRQIVRLLDVFIRLQERLPVDDHKSLFVRLLEPIIGCVTSPFYVSTFTTVATVSRLTPVQKLMLVKCPRFLATYGGPRMAQVIDQAFETTLSRYVLVLGTHISTVINWQRPVKRAVYHLLTIMTNAENYFMSFLTDGLVEALIDHLLRIVSEPMLIKNISPKASNLDSLLIDTALEVLDALSQESDVLKSIQARKPIETFKKLMSAPSKDIARDAATMVAYTIDDENIKHLENYYQQLLCVVLNLLHNTVETSDQKDKDAAVSSIGNSYTLSHLAETLLKFLRHERGKDEFLKQHALPFVAECTTKYTGPVRSSILKCLWTLAFDERVSQQLRYNSRLLQTLRQLSGTPTDAGISDLAAGTLWILLREPQCRDAAIKAADQPKKYDVMVSYAAKDKDAVDKLHETLAHAGYTVCLERDIDHRQSLENVSELMAKSSVVVVCLSSWYERDNRSVSEFVHAMKSGCVVVGCALEKGYATESWMLSTLDQNTLVEFDLGDIKRSGATVIGEINRRRRKTAAGSAAKPAAPSNPAQNQQQQQSARVVAPSPTPKQDSAETGRLQRVASRPNATFSPPRSIPVASTPLPPVLETRTPPRTIPAPPVSPSMGKPPRTPAPTRPTSRTITATPTTPQTPVPIRPASRALTSTPSASQTPVPTRPASRTLAATPTTSRTPVAKTPQLWNDIYRRYLPEQYLKRNTSNSKYRSTPINAWQKQDILDFLFDHDLIPMMPLCDTMSGRALLRFYQMCHKKPTRVFTQLNSELQSRFPGLTLPIGVYNEFLIGIDNLVDSPTSNTVLSPTPSSNYSYPPVSRPPSSVPSRAPTRLSSAPAENRSTPAAVPLPRIIMPLEKPSEAPVFVAQRVVQRAIFRPASAADRPYDFSVVSDESVDAIIDQLVRYEPQLNLLQKQAQEYRRKNAVVSK